MIKLRVGWDNDGVLHNFRGGLCDYLDSFKHEWKHDRNDTDTSWNFFEKWGMKFPDFKKVCDDGVDAGFVFNNNLRPNAVVSVNVVKFMGHHNVMITDRQFGSTPEASQRRTFDWIAENHLMIDEVHFSADKTSVPTDIFVEDKWENFVALMDHGTPCYLINRPWNEFGGPHENRIRDVGDYPAKVAAMTVARAQLLSVN